MENSIEEDIKNINKGLYELADSYELYHASWAKRIFESIKEKLNHILSDYKRVLKINEVLLKENEEWQKAYQEEKDSQFNLIKENQMLKSFLSGIFNENIEKDFIPVQKVKDKIEELNRKIDKSIDNSKGGLDEEFIEKAGELLAQKRILQELIEGRK